MHMQYQKGKSVSARAEESHITERQIARKTIDHIDPLRQHKEDDEVKEQQVVAVNPRENCKSCHHRHQHKDQVAKPVTHAAPASRAGLWAVPEG